ncbi:MAG: hypothetical protein PUB11_00610 [Oscillospiraceae bacterium]|nr:hypothetical protein [Oscillospiraceae bacterium]
MEEEKIALLEKENEFIKAQLKKQTQAKAVMICAVFFSSFMAASLLIYFFFDFFKDNSGIFMIEIILRAFCTGFSLLMWGGIQRLLFGDPLKDYEDNLYPQIEKEKESKLIVILVASLYIFQLIGYFLFAK